MFASLIPEIAAVSSQLIVSCDSRLIPLFERSFSKEIVLVSKDQIVPEHSYDYHIPIGSLPLTFRKELQSFKASAASYLKADRELSQTLKNTLIEVNDKPICGITWKGGSIKNQATRNKDISIEELGEVLKCFDYKYVNLQYGSTDTELETLKTDFGVEVECLSQIDNFSNLDGLASLISSCDYIVSVDNLTVHLAGALGVKTYVFLPFSADWRWGQDAKKSYWHSSLQLLRQKEIFNWLGPLEELRSHLE
jgi:ADP-heptose:LPS heptosyltransferase